MPGCWPASSNLAKPWSWPPQPACSPQARPQKARTSALSALVLPQALPGPEKWLVGPFRAVCVACAVAGCSPGKGWGGRPGAVDGLALQGRVGVAAVTRHGVGSRASVEGAQAACETDGRRPLSLSGQLIGDRRSVGSRNAWPKKLLPYCVAKTNLFGERKILSLSAPCLRPSGRGAPKHAHTRVRTHARARARVRGESLRNSIKKFRLQAAPKNPLHIKHLRGLGRAIGVQIRDERCTFTG